MTDREWTRLQVLVLAVFFIWAGAFTMVRSVEGIHYMKHHQLLLLGGGLVAAGTAAVLVIFSLTRGAGYGDR